VNETTLIGSSAQCIGREMEVRKVNKQLKSTGSEIKTTLLQYIRQDFISSVIELFSRNIL